MMLSSWDYCCSYTEMHYALISCLSTDFFEHFMFHKWFYQADHSVSNTFSTSTRKFHFQSVTATLICKLFSISESVLPCYATCQIILSSYIFHIWSFWYIIWLSLTLYLNLQVVSFYINIIWLSLTLYVNL